MVFCRLPRRPDRSAEGAKWRDLSSAINRQVAHYSYHIGQITFLAKHFAGASWQSLSIPKGRSTEYVIGTFKREIIPDR